MTGSGLPALVAGVVATDWSISWSLLPFRAAFFFSFFLDPKKEEMGWLNDRVCAWDGDVLSLVAGFLCRVGIS